MEDLRIEVFDTITKEIESMRLKVFVDEQNVPLELEQEGDDHLFIHFCLYKNKIPVATARASKDVFHCHVGRVLVLKEYRGLGYGKELIKIIHDYLKQIGVKRIDIGAMLYAKAFYEKLGYKAYGDVYLDSNIDHIKMYLEF